MQTADIIKEHHQMMVDRGFYECPECGGAGCFVPDPDRYCNHCKGSGIDPNKNIGELLALIVGELCGEALEAHRCGRFADFSDYSVSELNMDLLLEGLENKDFGAIAAFENTIKDTFEDELADVFLRLFDLCGYLGRELLLEEQYIGNYTGFDNVGQTFYSLIKTLPVDTQVRLPNVYNKFFTYLVLFSEFYNIPTEKHILSKMEYNRTRPHKHGKAY